MSKINGIKASKGLAFEKTYLIKEKKLIITKRDITDIEKEISFFNDAKEKAIFQIKNLKKDSVGKISEENLQIFDAHLNILNDPELEQNVLSKIKNDKVNASFATKEASDFFVNIFSTMEDEYFKERALDVKDVLTRVLKILENIEITDFSLIKTPCVIVAKDLTPSETSQLNLDYIKGIITEEGGATSHSAIIARTFKIPAIVGLGKEIERIKENTKILLDGFTGSINLNPNVEEIKEFEEKKKFLLKKQLEEEKFKNKSSISKDGWKTEIKANIGSPKDIKFLLESGAEGVGLLRSEFLYIDSKNWPTEQEQFESYKKVLESSGKQSVIIRMLDIGGDKHLDYFDFEEEMNPFLGYRAIRFQLDNIEERFIPQARALLRSAKYGNLHINIPMISTIEEFIKVKELFKKVEEDLKKEKIEFGKYKLGIMVEVPSVVALADIFAKHVDFFSIGTNDLIQYTFAVDRMSKKVSYLYQPFNPSILRMINTVIKSGHKENIKTAICGELASIPMLTPIFVGMGLDEFSMSPSSVLEIRSLISKINKKESEELLEKVLNLETQEQVKKEIKKFFKKNNIFVFE